VYMLMEMVQGGELYGIIHTRRRDGVNEADAKFYAAGIAEGLAYMHRRSFVYRDLKPENVMIDAQGYPVIVDFGFAKYVADKTYTLCGTPLYLAPEVILNRGHTFSADHWSLGVLTYEMITGYTPFYYDGMEQMDLFRAIVKGAYERPWNNKILSSIVGGLLCKIPAKRLGSLAGGEEGIYMHPWFKNIDFAALRNKQIKAPHVPKIKDPLDSSNFEDWSHLVDKTKERYPKLKPAQEELFDNF
jgi:serine/threonine protein kinase